MRIINPGMRLTVRRDLISGHRYGSDTVTSPMTRYAGKDVTVRYTYRDDQFAIYEDGGNWNWTIEMMEPVEDEVLNISTTELDDFLNAFFVD